MSLVASLSLDQQPEVQKAMRDLVITTHALQFLIDNELTPNIGSYVAVALKAIMPDKLWHGNGTKVKSIHSLIIKVGGKECKCLWCGNVQKDKLQCRVGHSCTKHLEHELFHCGDVHVSDEIW